MFRGPNGAGKGDKPRPIQDREQFDSNWDAIFKKKEKIPTLNEALRTYDGKLDKENNGNKDQKNE